MKRAERKAIVHSIVHPYLTAKKDRTIKTQYERIRPAPDGVVRTVLSPVVTETGRLASGESFLDPYSTNLQNLSMKESYKDELYRVRDCVAPDTLVFMADFSWKQIDDVSIGDRIIAFGEHGPNRHWEIATVLNKLETTKIAYRIETEGGFHLTASGNHEILKKKSGNPIVWCDIDSIHVGTPKKRWRVYSIVKPWNERMNKDAGWVAGFMDGEASVSTSRGCTLYIPQNPNGLLDKLQDIMASDGFDTGRHRRGNRDLEEVYTRGGTREVMRCLGLYRPARLIKNTLKGIESVELVGNHDPVISKECVGEQRLIDITTTSGTFIANGLGVHNCFISLPGMSFVALDLDKAEAVVVSFESQDWAFYEALISGADIHTDLAADSFHGGNAKGVSKHERQVCKNVTYASLYMAGIARITRTINEDSGTFGFKLTEDEVEKVYNVLLEVHPLEQWWNKVWQELLDPDLYGGYRWLENALGFRRMFYNPDDHKLWKEAVNFPPQSTVAGVIDRAMIAAWEHHDEPGVCELLHQVHDELIFQVADDKILQVVPELIGLMEQPFEARGREVYMPSGAKIGKRWDPFRGSDSEPLDPDNTLGRMVAF